MADDRTVPHRRSLVPVRTLRVEVTRGPDAGRAVVAGKDRVSVGSSPDNDLALTDETVSRYHLELSHTGDAIEVRDLGSTNGTVVGPVALQQAQVAAGTELVLGKSAIRVLDGEPVPLELFDDERLANLRGRSPRMLELMATISRVARSDASVLLLGETGVGKERIAEAIHLCSPRAEQPFEIVDGGALSPTLVASELFGHEKGAFTGADRRHVGAFERAHGGTLFLDEIGELPPSLQTMLLGALERGSFRRVGGTEPIHVDVRVVCATHRDLREAVNAQTFRQDLYYRIAVVLLRVPPLRERLEDIPVLVEHFLREAGFGGPVEQVIPPRAMRGLEQHRWPGNVRELRNFVDAALAMGETPHLESAGAPPSPEAGGAFPSVPMQELLRSSYKDARARVLTEFERLYLEALLERSEGNVSKAARVSEIHRSYLNEMLKRHRLR